MCVSMGISFADEGLKQDQVISYFHCPGVWKSIVNFSDVYVRFASKNILHPFGVDSPWSNKSNKSLKSCSFTMLNVCKVLG